MAQSLSALGPGLYPTGAPGPVHPACLRPLDLVCHRHHYWCHRDTNGGSRVRVLKAAPTTYVLHYQRSRLRREGPGLTFLYFRPASTIVAVPLASTGILFVFNEIT